MDNKPVKSTKPGKTSTPQDQQDAIVAYITLGTFATAEEQTGWGRQSISKWVKDDPNRYQSLIETYKTQLDKYAANQMRTHMLKLIAASEDLIGLISNNMHQIPPEKRPEALQKMVWVTGSYLDKLRTIEEKPTAIVEHRNIAELQKELAGIIEGTAVDA